MRRVCLLPVLKKKKVRMQNASEHCARVRVRLCACVRVCVCVIREVSMEVILISDGNVPRACAIALKGLKQGIGKKKRGKTGMDERTNTRKKGQRTLPRKKKNEHTKTETTN